MSELLKINVNDHTEKKNGLTYLSWAWAWAEVLKVDPLATWSPIATGPQNSETPWFVLPDGSMLVGVSVAIKGHAKSCMLPVMDHRNKAIKNPDAFAVNTALMRCLAKCIAMHGLGLYIYAGEDLPEEDKPVKKDAGGAIKATAGALESLPADERDYIKEMAADITSMTHPDAMVEAIEAAQLEDEQKVALWSLLPSNIRSAIKREQDRKQTA